jgi:SagB-type dehydrogenase family enzyme
VESDRDETAWPWASWSPEASFFFFGTRGGKYPSDPQRYDATLRRKAKHDPPPDPVKSMAGPRVKLPAPRPLGDLSDALRDRRTWRHFSAAPVGLPDLATLLRSTWGVQKWGAVKGQGRVALKTSPSGGARHAIEAYVLARNVEGLPASVFHYDAAGHELVRLGHRVTRQTITRLLVNQFYYGDAAALVVMTAVFPRAMWRYPFSRALRTVLTEAGHLGQTFCLAATSLGLAPFTVMAFDELRAESLLTVDGVNECALYVVGVGHRSARHATQPGGLTEGDRP